MAATSRRLWLLLAVLAQLVILVPIIAAVLPEDRADALFHAYSGGGVDVSGPSILMRKMFGTRSSMSANYYVDSITSASIDVVTSASPYHERREEKAVSGDFLVNDDHISIGFTNSEENDFSANTASFNIDHELFGNLTTVSIGYSRGWDVIGKRGDSGFSEEAARQSFHGGISQILTRDAILALNIETVTDSGYLNNPYRSVRYIDPGSAVGYSFEPEHYPRTHTSTAIALKGRYHLPIRASLFGEYRYYTDSWGVDAWNAALGYTHVYRRDWTLDLRYRYYRQGHADFYSDLFPFSQARNFLARDKELSAFSSQSLGLGVSYRFAAKPWSGGLLDEATINLSLDRIAFDYQDFRNLTAPTMVPGTEPLYAFSANVFQLYLSLWY